METVNYNLTGEQNTSLEARLTKLIDEPITEGVASYTFGWGTYGHSRVIIRNDGYINASALCRAYGKDFNAWNIADYINVAGKLPNGKFAADYVEGSDITSGAYIHAALLPILLSWLSCDNALYIATCVNNYILGAENKTDIIIGKLNSIIKNQKILRGGIDQTIKLQTSSHDATLNYLQYLKKSNDDPCHIS